MKINPKIISDILIIFLIAFMVGMAEISGEKEIIFPEIAALTVGSLAAPKRSWRTSRMRMLAAMTVCSLLGLGISVLLPMLAVAKIYVAFLLCQVFYLLSGTTFAPMISAAVLPVLMGSDSIIYPISAVCLTALVLLAEGLMMKLKIRPDEEFTPVGRPVKKDWLDAALRCGIVAVTAFAAIECGVRFCIAPPLLVAFTEFSRTSCSARKKPVRAVAVITVCAAVGAASRLLICVCGNLPLTVSAAMTAIIVMAVIRRSGMYLPPAGALAVLPLIIPEENLIFYPIQILAGAAFFMACAKIFFSEKSDINEHQSGVCL